MRTDGRSSVEAPAASPDRSGPRRSRAPLRMARGMPLSHRLLEHLIRLAASVAVAAIVLIFVFVLREALPLFFDEEAARELGGLDALVAPRIWTGHDTPAFVWQPVGEVPKMNVVPLVVASLKVTSLALAFAVPLALGAAIHVSQYAARRTREILKPAIELVASIPSVVLGFAALMLLASVLHAVLGTTYRLNLLVAGLALAFGVVPMVFTLCEDALSSVPSDLAHGAFALGARKHQVILRVVVPSAYPGIAAAVLLGLGRALGETMIVLMASGNAAVLEPWNPTSSGRTITATIAAELGEVAQGSAHWRVLFLLGAVLFVVTFVTHRAGALLVARLRRRLGVER